LGQRSEFKVGRIMLKLGTPVDWMIFSFFENLPFGPLGPVFHKSLCMS